MSRRIRTQASVEPEYQELRTQLYECVEDIINDLEQRKGIGDEWESMHPIYRREIADRWHEILCQKFGVG